LVLQASVVLAAALAASFALRRRSAALRHFVLAAGVAAVLAAAAFARVLPAWEITMPPAVERVPAADTGRAVPGPLASAPASSDAPAQTPAQAPAQSSAPDVSWPWRLAIVWLAGAAAIAGRLLAGLVALRRVSRRAVRVSDERLIEMSRL